MDKVRIVLRPLPNNSLEDDHTSRWNPRDWSPNSVLNRFDRRVAHIVLINCVKVLQNLAHPETARPVIGIFYHGVRRWHLYLVVGEFHHRGLNSLGKRRQEQAIKQLLAKTRRLLARKAASGKHLPNT